MTNLNDLANDIYLANKEKGFWSRERPLVETTMLIVTELAEAVEEERAGRAGVWYSDPAYNMHYDADMVAVEGDHLAHPLRGSRSRALKPEGVDIELVDALIRLLDLLGFRGTDVEELLKQKLAFNESRPARHGKAY